MTEEKNFELKVGLFVTIGIMIFFMIAFSIGDVTFVKQGYQINIIFNYVDGVSESSPVKYAGVNIGRVKGLTIFYDKNELKTKVKVAVMVDDINRTIEKDSIPTINTLGLLGEQYIEIKPGDMRAGILAENDTLVGKDPIMMSDVSESLTSIAESTNVVMDRLKEGRGTIGKLLTEDAIYDDLEEFVEDIKNHPWKLLHKPKGQ